MSAPDGGSAFPGVRIENHGGTIQEDSAPGMTLRDYFAAKAMAAMINQQLEVRRMTPDGVLILPAREGVPPIAYEYADAMLKVRAAQ